MSGLIDKLERADSLDKWADRLAVIAQLPHKSRRLTTLLSGTRLGHPAHPMVVAVPMGSWLAATYLDAVGASPTAARRLVGLGLVSSVPAFATGSSDWSYTEGAERRVGLVHAAGNWLAAGLYAGSWFARGRGQRGAGIALAATGAVTLGLTGWLGGHLSFARGVGVDTTAFQVAPADWVDVLAEGDLPEATPTLVHAGGVPVLIIRQDNDILAIADRCSHRGAPLHEGTVADGCVTCPWHGGEFRINDGRVMTGPPTRPQSVFQTRTRYGMVQVRRADEPGSLRTNPVT